MPKHVSSFHVFNTTQIHDSHPLYLSKPKSRDRRLFVEDLLEQNMKSFINMFFLSK